MTVAELVLIAIVVLPMLGRCRMNSMPGNSFAGPLPPLTPGETELAANLRRHIDALAVEIGERNVWRPETMVKASGYIVSQLQSMGYDVSAAAYEAEGQTVANLIAGLPGTGSFAREVLVIGAHYDTVPHCAGANDNGSGVAAVLEIARVMRQDRPRRTVRFVLFPNEEPPFFQTDLMGSVVYARSYEGGPERVVGMMALETIGYYSDAPGSQDYPPPYKGLFPDTGNFIAFVGNDGSAAFVRDVVGSFRRHTSFPSEGVAAPASVQGVGWSDHWAFWQAGCPALMVTDTAPFRYPHYHEPTDTPDKIDYERTARVVAGLVRVTRELAGADERN